ncbi:MAG: TIGR01620 family protein [Proteobacteria bacterium]|nr:TIGR01620 family protein [Pseudomonadota bacterium]MBS0573138.1 TIGR01620 family protein [Pseudomonadota bacterium]
MDKVRERTGPVAVEVEAGADLSPATAPALPDEGPQGGAPQVERTMRALLGTDRRRGGAGWWFLGSALSLGGFLLSLAAWNYVTALLSAHPLLGAIAAALFAAFLLSAGLLALREALGYLRLAGLDRLRTAAAAALAADDLGAARRVVADLGALYRGRADQALGARRIAGAAGEVMDAETLLALAEREHLSPLDQAARREIEAAARQVAAVTAIVPLALADVAAALVSNLRMVGRIARIYGGRAGLFGSLRILRAVMVHLVATGAVAVGDDLIHSVAGGGLLSKLSRRFGEGVINGALTARVGVAAMEVCRPLPFRALARPKITNLLSRGLKGLFGAEGDRTDAGKS